MPSSLLFAINNEGRVFGLSTTGTKWREFVYLGLEFKHLSAVPHFMWAVGGDRQVYVHVHGLDIPIRIKEEAYENERWLPIEGFSGRLLPTDRYHYSSQDGTCNRSLDKIRLPSMAWQWEGDWHLETTLDGLPLDHDGWTYAVDFPATYHPKKQWKSCVRRRKWIRYRRYSALNSWCAIAPLHKDPTQEPFIAVAVGGQSVSGGNPGTLLVWAITAHGRVMFRTGVSTTAPEGLRWTSIPVPAGCEVKQISIGPTGLVWAVLWNGRALVRAGVTRESLTGEFWLEVGAPEDLKLSHVSVGTNAVWAVTGDQRVWFRKGIRGESAGNSEELARGAGWVEMVGNMAIVSVAANDQVFAIGSEDRCLYFRTGVLPSELTGKQWRAIYAPTQLSRTSSNASLWSANYRHSLCGGTPREKRVRSWSSLARNSCGSDVQSLIQDSEETSRSAPTPTSLRLQPALWQRSSDGASLSQQRPSCSEESVIESCGAGQLEKRYDEDTQSSQSSNEMINTCTTIQEHSEGSVTEIQPVLVMGKGGEVKKNPTVWSPVRSVGSIVGMEAHPESDGSVFEPASGDSGVFGEDDDAEAMYWLNGDVVWCVVEAGACTVDPLYLPSWFVDVPVVPDKVEFLKPWRVKILQELKKRLPEEGSSFEKYEKAVEMSSWVKTGKARCKLKDSDQQFEDCILELEWVGSEKGSLDSGTLSVLSLDKKHTKMQFSLSEITCVVCCSEPSKPRIAIHTPKLTKGSSPFKLQFSGDTDMEDWMANLTSVCCQMFGVRGPPSAGSIWITTGLGDVFVFDPAVLEASQLNGELYAQELDVAGKATPYEAHLHNGFPPGTILTIQGCIHDDCDRFSVNLQCSSVSQRHKSGTDLIFHFNPRFKEAIIVRNSMLRGEWGVEEREGEMVFKQGAEFTIDIYCQDEVFKICVNGNLHTYYTHREKPHNVTHVGINGGVSLSKVVYQSKMVIAPPPEMFWRQMGGHLRRVETCSAGVTWGIGYDNTAWVYTGGWGGSFLKGLETSSSGINPMRDTHNYYVYENQRWNPLTGYTSHGLPTDRYMWSDVTGKHKRTREKTKLLSMHWQWVSDWSIDYHTPGGVDKEGWQYAIDFPATYHGQKHFTDYVRRRRWIRKTQVSTSGPWQELGNIKLLDVSLQASDPSSIDSSVDVWAVAANGDAVYRKGVSSSCPTGALWEHVPSDHLASISCGPDKRVWAVGKNGSAYWRLGITSSDPIGKVWETVEPPTGKTLKHISVGCCAVWGLDSAGQLSVRREITPVFPEGTHWQTVATTASDMGHYDKSSSSNNLSQNNTIGFRHVSAGPAQGEVWAITAAGVVCRRHGVTPDNPAGTGWSHGIGGNWQHISARGCNMKPQT